MKCSRSLFLTVVALLLSCLSVFAQRDWYTDPALFHDKAAHDTSTDTAAVDNVVDSAAHRQVISLPTHVDSSDLILKKIVWREIDTREKQNMVFRYPGNDEPGGGYFIEILLNGIKNKVLKAYSPMDESFSYPIDTQTVMQMLPHRDDTEEVFDRHKKHPRLVITKKAFDPDLVVKYRIKEHWSVDMNTGAYIVQIIGIAPMISILDTTAEGLPRQAPWFWLSYPECRSLLSLYELYTEADMARSTWEDFFQQRYFKSYIINDNNESNFDTSEVERMEALYKTGSREEMKFMKEQGMWVY